jgi:hypothetical protein
MNAALVYRTVQYITGTGATSKQYSALNDNAAISYVGTMCTSKDSEVALDETLPIQKYDVCTMSNSANS